MASEGRFRRVRHIEIVHHRGVGRVLGEVGLHIEEDVEEKAERGGGIAGEIVMGHLGESEGEKRRIRCC